MTISKRRLPAFGKIIKEGLRRGLRPVVGGGGFVVSTRWDYAKPYARMVCPPEVPVEEWDLSFLRGCQVIVLVPEDHRSIGEQLKARLIDAGAALVVLSVHLEDLP